MRAHQAHLNLSFSRLWVLFNPGTTLLYCTAVVFLLSWTSDLHFLCYDASVVFLTRGLLRPTVVLYIRCANTQWLMHKQWLWERDSSSSTQRKAAQNKSKASTKSSHTVNDNTPTHKQTMWGRYRGSTQRKVAQNQSLPCGQLLYVHYRNEKHLSCEGGE